LLEVHDAFLVSKTWHLKSMPIDIGFGLNSFAYMSDLPTERHV